MDNEAIKIIENAIRSGTDKHATRRELVSQGLPTTGFDDVYATALKRLGVSEPKMQMPKLAPSGEVPLKVIKPSKKPIKFFIEVIIVCILVGGGFHFELHKKALAWIFNTIPSGAEEQEGSINTEINFGDGVLKKKVDATVASAQIYRGRMLDYEGVCTDIAVVEPVMCKEKKETISIFTRLSDGSYYCVDEAGKVGTTPFSTESEVGCK